MELTQGETRPTASSRTPHFNVSCQTCRISKTFVTLQGVNMFFLDHEGHKVIEGTLFERPQVAKPEPVTEIVVEEVSKPLEAAPVSSDVIAHEVEPQPNEEPEVVVRVEMQELRAPSELVAQPAETRMEASAEHLQVAGALDIVTEEVSKPQEAAREIVQWSSEIIGQEIKPQVKEAAEAEVRQEAPASPEQETPSAERHMEALVERLQNFKKPDAVSQEVSRPEAGEAHEMKAGRGNSIFLEFKPQMEEEADVLVREEAPAPILQLVQPAQAQPKGPIVALAPLMEKDVKESLLLARSSYIEDSNEMRLDAMKVSRALREFKWNVEPPYVIGVMVDNNLSIETNVGVVSDAMVEKVESLGYKLVAVNAPQGSPVAWFKRQGMNFVGDAEKTMKTGIQTSEKDMAVWQASFVSLLMTVKDMDVKNLQRVTGMIKSGRPEPEIQP